MNIKLSKALIKHCNAFFLTRKKLINGLQFFWKVHIFWNFLHKPWHNNIKKNLKIFEEFLENFFKKYSKEYSPKNNPLNRQVQLMLSHLHPLQIYII
jgi:hypothetical protein